MPVNCGTRLERLRALRTQIEQEIKLEERSLVANVGGRLRAPRALGGETGARGKASHAAGLRTAEMLAELGVTAADVKAWAFEAGLVAYVARGRVAQALIEAYADAHAVSAEPEHVWCDRCGGWAHRALGCSCGRIPAEQVTA